MTQHVNHHPSINLLELYCDGSLNAEVALLVAAHLDFCPHCQQLRHDIETDLGGQLAASSPLPTEVHSVDWLEMLNKIVATPQLTEPAVAPQLDSSIAIGNYAFTLPRSLCRVAAKRSKWLSIGGIATARLPSGEPHHASLLFIDKHTDVPLHTHHGLEMTLVLAGEMVDENGRYGPGDLIINSPDDTHQPRNISDEPCLCLSVLSAPLQFKSGITRWLNPLQRFFY